MQEVEKTQTSGQRNLDAAVERLLNLMKQMSDRLEVKDSELGENFNNLQREM